MYNLTMLGVQLKVTRLSLFLILVQTILQACSSNPQTEPAQLQQAVVVKQQPSIVNLEIKSAADVNPDTDGIGSPVMLRIYELRETSGFNSADFFSLFNNDQSTLSAELARKQELLIKPGDIKPLSIQLESEIRALGFFVAFRQVDTAQWRVIMPITPNKTQSAVINLRGNKLVLEPVGTGH